MVTQRRSARGLLVLGAGKNAVRFSPPLVLTRAQADTAVRIFDEALTEVETTTVEHQEAAEIAEKRVVSAGFASLCGCSLSSRGAACCWACAHHDARARRHLGKPAKISRARARAAAGTQ